MTADEIVQATINGSITPDQAARLIEHYAKQSRTEKAKQKKPSTKSRGRPKNSVRKGEQFEAAFLYWYAFQQLPTPPKKGVVTEFLAEVLGFEDAKSVGKMITKLRKKLKGCGILRSVGDDKKINVLIIDPFQLEFLQRTKNGNTNGGCLLEVAGWEMRLGTEGDYTYMRFWCSRGIVDLVSDFTRSPPPCLLHIPFQL